MSTKGKFVPFQALEACSGMQVQLLRFSVSAVDGVSGQPHIAAAFILEFIQ